MSRSHLVGAQLLSVTCELAVTQVRELISHVGLDVRYLKRVSTPAAGVAFCTCNNCKLLQAC